MPLKLTPAVMAAIFLAVDSPIPLLLFHHQLHMHRIVTLLVGPTQVVKNHTPKRRITYDPTNSIEVLQTPSYFRRAYFATKYDGKNKGGFADSVVFSVVLICLAALKSVAISSRQLSLHRQPPIAPHSTKERSKKERYRYGAGKGDIVSEGEHF